MELVEAVFAQLNADIQSRLKILERQVIAIVANANREPSLSKEVKEDMEQIKKAMRAVQERVNKLEINKTSQTPLTTGSGLDGLVMRPLTLPSPILNASNSNSIVMPLRNVVINEPDTDDIVPDEEAMAGQRAEAMGGIDEVDEDEEQEEESEQEDNDDADNEEEENADEEQEEDNADEEEDNEEETEELQAFEWKGKTYGISSQNFVHRLTVDGAAEDEPFAQYDPKTNRLLKI